MPLFGDGKVMALKIIWDFAYYWAIPAAFFFHHRLTDLMAFGEAREPLDRSSALNGALQKLFREWHKSSGEIAATFIDIPGIPFMHALNCGLQDRLDSTQFRDRLHANLALLDQLAVEILAFARQDDPTLSFAGFEKLAGQGPSLLSGVLPKLSRVKGKPSAEAHAGTT
jgi:hypothetical protein